MGCSHEVQTSHSLAPVQQLFQTIQSEGRDISGVSNSSSFLHSCILPKSPWSKNPHEVVEGAEEVGEESDHGQEVDHEEEPGVGHDALVEEPVHVAVEERVGEAGDVGVRAEEDGEAEDGEELGGGSVKVGEVAAGALAEGLPDLVDVPAKQRQFSEEKW